MKLTNQQQEILRSKGNIKINAVAGSGKTTTLIEYAKSRPKNSGILYLAFNKSVKEEARDKFSKYGLSNIEIQTAHSLAYKHTVKKYRYKVINAYKTYEIKELLDIKFSGKDPQGEYILASHINRLFEYFCNSKFKSIDEVDYLSILKDEQVKKFAKNFFKNIVAGTKSLFEKMDKGEIDVTHSFYLKKFQIDSPALKYDYILFDEGQDASEAMLDVFLKQNAVKVIVGDTHQQIYAWRYAINSLEQVDYTDLYLTQSFRFNEEIAFLAMKVLGWKKLIMDYEPRNIWGSGKNGELKNKAVIARTNLALLQDAIVSVCKEKVYNKIYFEGNIGSYTYARDGASLYDVLNLYNGNRKAIKDKILRHMESFDDLQNYVNKTGDVELSIMYKVIEEYKNEIPQLLNTLKEKHVAEGKKNEAEVIFSTVHKCKGMEYDEVTLLEDFISKDKILKQLETYGSDKLDIQTINEEINLLYVAMTRTKSKLNVPIALTPSFESINIIDDDLDDDFLSEIMNQYLYEEEEEHSLPFGNGNNKNEAYFVKKIREKYPNAYKKWTQEEDDELEVLYCEGKSVEELATFFGRKRGAITSRIQHLELDLKYSI